MYSITQTPDGYLWIGGEAGLIRFDGWTFRVIQKTGAVLGLLTDRDGQLWVRTLGPQLMSYRNGALHAPDDLRDHSNVTAMSVRRDGALIGSATEQGAFVRRDGRFELLNTAAALPRSTVTAIAQTADHAIWIGTRDAGLFRVSGKQVSPATAGLPDPKVNVLLAEPSGELWIGTDNGVARWDGRELAPVDLGRAERRTQVLALAKDRDGNLWVGTNARGLFRVSERGIASLSTGSDEAVTALFEDREGSLWIGTAHGLERLRDSPFITYSTEEGLPSDGSTPIHLDAEDRLWFGPERGGLWWTKRGQHGQIRDDGLDRDIVYAIGGRDGDVWAGRQRGGLTRIRDGRTTTWTSRNGLAQDSVYSVHQSSDGVVWAGTLSAGVSRFSNGTFTTFTSRNGLASNMVASILEGSDGAMWFATPAGLTLFRQGTWRTFTDRDGLPSSNINCLFEDEERVIWVGSTNGLAFGDRRGFRAVQILREQILGIAQDRQDSLWIATAGQVVRINRERLRSGTFREGDIRAYGLADGLRGIEGIKRNRSVVSDSLGRVWFSLNRGISVVDPGRLGFRPPAAILHVESLTADGHSLATADAVTIPPGSQRVTLGFTATILTLPERVRFQYLLEEFDRDFSDPVSAREAVYTNLPPGRYRFRVRAANGDGVWNSPETSLAFVIEPAFWQTWWFRVAVVAAFILCVIGMYRLRLLAVTRRMNALFDERLAERTRIAQDLHDTLLQGFLSASMHLHVTADQIPESSLARASIRQVLSLMERVIAEGRDAVRGLRSSDHSSDDLGQAFSRIQQELGADDRVGFRVVVEGHPRAMHPVIRDEVYRIGREAVVNAFRHARPARIEVELEYTSKRFRVTIRDDGCGIDPTILKTGREGHWGLHGMRERAERIGARLQVFSSATAGTEVELSMPERIAFGAPVNARATGIGGVQ